MSLEVAQPPRCRFCSTILEPPGHICGHCNAPQAIAPAPSMALGGVAAKSPGIAVLLSFIWLGAGHLYAGQVGLGVALMVFDAFLVLLAFTLIGLIIAVPLWLISAPIVMVLAYSAAKRFNERNGIVVR